MSGNSRKPPSGDDAPMVVSEDARSTPLHPRSACAATLGDHVVKPVGNRVFPRAQECPEGIPECNGYPQGFME